MHMHVGMVGYAYQQITGDSGSGARFGDFNLAYSELALRSASCFWLEICRAISTSRPTRSSPPRTDRWLEYLGELCHFA
jgi:hypothetical protein